MGNVGKFLYIWELHAGKGDFSNESSSMGTDRTERKWVVVRIDGKIAAVSTDYRMLARISLLSSALRVLITVSIGSSILSVRS